MTKGPWKVFWIASPAGVSARIYSEATTPPTDIAHVPKEWTRGGSDATLIAAAPEMLEALGRAADRIENLISALVLPARADIHLRGVSGTLPEIRDEIRAAIAKAEGR